jgi:hypothetical protein
MNIPLWFFPALVAMLQLCAAVVYLDNNEYRLAIVWLGVAISNSALAAIR